MKIIGNIKLNCMILKPYKVNTENFPAVSVTAYFQASAKGERADCLQRTQKHAMTQNKQLQKHENKQYIADGVKSG